MDGLVEIVDDEEVEVQVPVDGEPWMAVQPMNISHDDVVDGAIGTREYSRDVSSVAAVRTAAVPVSGRRAAYWCAEGSYRPEGSAHALPDDSASGGLLDCQADAGDSADGGEESSASVTLTGSRSGSSEVPRFD